MQRRDFLRARPTAAGAAGAAASLPLNLLLGEAAKREALAAALPSPPNMPIDHFVVLMMENRSFDHYFGWLPNADAVQQRTYMDPDNGNASGRDPARVDARAAPVAGLRPPRPRPLLERRPRAARQLAHRTRRRSRMGSWPGDNDEFALCYYDEGDLGFIHPAGKEFTVYDRFHCSLMGPTWPNRYYKWSAQSGGSAGQHASGGHARQPVGDALRPRAADNPATRPRPGLTARYYNSDLPFSAVWGPRGAAVDSAGRRLLRRLRRRHAAEHLVRRPAVPRRRRRRRRCRPTSTRSATCGWARRSCPTSCMPSSSRPTGSAARCSSSTTSGEGSSTTCGRPASPTIAQQLQHRQRLRPDGIPHPGRGGLALRAAAARSATSSAGSSRSSS